ncbi:hypothetical protein RDABS01_009680 [Bienertia sinuspersici]
MDRRWMNHNGVKDRRKLEYVAGVNEFLQFAFRDKKIEQNESLWDYVEEGTPNLEEVVAANDDEVRLVKDDAEPELVDVDIVLEATKNADMDNESEEEEESDKDDDDELDTNSSDHELDEDLEDNVVQQPNVAQQQLPLQQQYGQQQSDQNWQQQLDSQNGQQKLNQNGQQQLDQNGQQHQQILEQQQYQDVEQQHNEEQLTPSTKLTYREKRRLEQAELRLKYPNQKRCGPTRGKKYVSRTWNSNSKEKIKINFIDELRRVVGEKADEFICDCSNWVKEYCPVDSWNWAKMDKLAKQRLYDKIRGKYDLPDKVGGADVIEALSLQCSMLYKHWRFRLKEQHFRNKSVAEAINSRPSTINVDDWTWLVCEYWNDEKRKRISKINTENKLKQTESPQMVQGPLQGFFTTWHKESGWEPNAQKDYEALKKLHEKEVEKHGEDTLSVKAAYMEVFKHKSGYVRGLGPGARPPKKSRAEGESNEVRVELSAEIQQLKEDAATREGLLISQIETLKTSNEELRTSNEELIASNDELKATVSRINIEAIKREKKLRDDMMKMFEQMSIGIQGFWLPMRPWATDKTVRRPKVFGLRGLGFDFTTKLR